jgi:exoribonuclease II
MKIWYGETLQNDPDPQVRQAIARSIRAHLPPEPEDIVGCVVEFQRGRQCCIGAICATEGRSGKVRVVDSDGKKRRIDRRWLLHVARQKLPLGDGDELRHALRRITRRRTEQGNAVELQALWELVAEEEGKWWTFAELAEIFFAARPGDDEGAALARALADGEFFAMKEGRFQALPLAAVERRGHLARARDQAEADLTAQAAWLRAVADGLDTEPPPAATTVVAWLEKVALAGDGALIGVNALADDEALPKEAIELMRRAHLHGAAAAFDVLVRLGHWQADENLDIRRWGIPLGFNDELEATARQVRPKGRARRWWGRQVWGWAEEGEICDRVFSLRRTLGGYRLGIHCSALALAVEASSPLDVEAASRGSALVLPDRRQGVVPASLEGDLGFVAGKRQWALSLVLHLGRDFGVRDCYMRLSRVRPQKIQAASGPVPPLFDLLAAASRRRRRLAGALVLPPLPVVSRRQDGCVIESGEQGARPVLEELDYIAAEHAGLWCQEQGLAALYRSRPLPAVRLDGDSDSDKDKDKAWEAHLLHQQLKYLVRPEWQVQALSEASAGLRCFVPWNRPSHSYLDLLMQRQIIHYLRHGKGLYGEVELHAALKENAWSREAVGHIQARARRYWMLKELEARVGQVLDAVVVERLGAAFVLHLGAVPLKALLPPERETRLRVGDVIRVRLQQVSARGDEIRLVLA